MNQRCARTAGHWPIPHLPSSTLKEIVASLNEADERHADGLYATLTTRQEVNDFIGFLQSARDGAFGKDR